MTASVTHAFVSPVADQGDPNLVGPDEWNGKHVVSGLVEIATGALDYYVEKTGSDSNDGTTALTPFLTINRALEELYKHDMRGFNFKIHVGTGTFAEQLLFSPGIGVDDVYLIGNGYANTIIKPTTNGGTGLGIIALNHFSRLIIGENLTSNGIHLDASDPGWAGWECLTTFSARVTVYSPVKMTQLANDGWYAIRMFGPGSDVDGLPFIIDMPGNQAACISCSDSFFETGGLQFISNTAFSEAFVVFGGSTALWIDKPTVTGTVTGKRHIFAGKAGFIDNTLSGDPNFFPGDVAGTVDATSFALTTAAGAMWGTISIPNIPTTTDIPFPTTFAVVKDTVGGGVYVAYNDAGTIKKVALT